MLPAEPKEPGGAKKDTATLGKFNSSSTFQPATSNFAPVCKVLLNPADGTQSFQKWKKQGFFFSFFHDNKVQWVYISPLIFKHHTYQQFFITKRKKEFYNLTNNSCKHVKESAHCINKAEKGIAWSKLGNGAAHRHSPAMEIYCWGAQRDCCRPLLWGTLQKYQHHKNTRTVSDQRSLNPVSGPWQRPQMDTEGRERTRQAHMILPSLYSPYLQLFSGQGIFWARRGFTIFRFLNGFLLQVLLQLFIEPREGFGIHIFQQQFSQVCYTLYDEPPPFALNLTATSFV